MNARPPSKTRLLAMIFAVTAAVAAHAPVARADLIVSGSAGISRYDETTGQYLGTIIPGPTGSFAVGPDQNIYKFRAIGGGAIDVSRYDAATGAFLGDFASTIPDFHPGNPGADVRTRMAFSPDGNFFYLLAYSNLFSDTHVLQYDGTSGTYLKELFRLTYFAATRLGIGPDGVVYVSDTVNGGGYGYVNGYDPITGNPSNAFATLVYPGGPFLIEPGPFAFDGAGNFYVSDSCCGGPIYKFDGVTHDFVGTFASAPSGYFLRYVFGPDGDLYATLSNQNGVFRFDGSTGAYLGQFDVGGPEGFIYEMTFAQLPPLVPEPSTLLLLGAGLIGLLLGVRRNRRPPLAQ